MDGTLAVIFLVTSLTDMVITDCPNACLQQTAATARLNMQAGNVVFQDDTIDQEVYVGYDTDRSYGPFHTTFGASATAEGDLWIGAGAKWTSQDLLRGPFFIETSLMPGLYAKGDGPDLGGALQFRSAFGAGYEFDNGGTVTVLYDHRSNADTQNLNPGLETLGIRYAIALN